MWVLEGEEVCEFLNVDFSFLISGILSIWAAQAGARKVIFSH